jgi:hypothetical protein
VLLVQFTRPKTAESSLAFRGWLIGLEWAPQELCLLPGALNEACFVQLKLLFAVLESGEGGARMSTEEALKKFLN